MDLRLEGKSVLVTGGSRGIGRAIAEAYVAEGANVLIVGRTAETLDAVVAEVSAGKGAGTIKSRVCDCSDEAQLLALRHDLERAGGELDIVVANVGSGKSVPDVVPGSKEWQLTWSNNFEPALFTARTFVGMLERSAGNIIFISSIAGLGAMGAPVDYATAKAAISALARNMALKLGAKVRVNVVAPGCIFFKDGTWDEKQKADPEMVQTMLDSQIPMKRFGTPQEIAFSVLFLSSEKAAYITGTTHVADGGQTLFTA
jgi:3-oxoacyl-[acyl-carrier protein] reductase